MEVKRAPIDLKKFVVPSVRLETIPVPPDRKEKKLPPLPLDLDFNVFAVPNEPRLLRIVVRILANGQGKLPGYRFEIVAEGLFEFATEPSATDELKREETVFFALPLLIHSTRAYLLNLTAAGPYGPFALPMPDVKDLLEKKRAADAATKAKDSSA